MIGFIKKHWEILVLLVALAAGARLMYSWGVNTATRTWELAWSQRDLDEAQERARLEAQYRTKEKELNGQLHDQQVNYDSRLAEMQSIQSDAGAQSVRLREQVAELRDRLRAASSTPANSGQLPPGTGAAMVLSDLYAGCVAHRSGLAAAFDRSRVRGLEVEKMYDRARGQ